MACLALQRVQAHRESTDSQDNATFEGNSHQPKLKGRGRGLVQTSGIIGTLSQCCKDSHIEDNGIARTM